MTINRPNVEPGGYYSQKDAAEALGVDRHTIRRYERLKLIRFARRYGRRKWTTGRQILRCWDRLHPKI